MTNDNQNQKQDYRQIRIDKLNSLKEQWVQVYPWSYERTHSCKQAKGLKEWTSWISVAWRLMLFRTFWSLSFATIQDQEWRIQIAFQKKTIWDEVFKLIEKKLDIWDFIWVRWEHFITKHWEPSILAKEFIFLWKALRPLPEKFHWLTDEEIQYRQRYLDLIMNKETMDRFKFRSDLIKSIRKYYWENWFYEVETSTLEQNATWAAAKPYTTHNNWLDIDVVLRISMEFPHKKLIVWGFEKIFEIWKAFRNEWIDPSHLPEHTHFEHYVAYWSYKENMQYMEALIKHIIKDLWLPDKIMIKDKSGEEREVDFWKKFEVLSYIDLIKKDCWIDILKVDTIEKLTKAIKDKNIVIEWSENMWYWTLVDYLYKKVSRPQLIWPVFLIDYPKEIQPFARPSDDNQRIVEQAQLVINWWEIIKLYSELVDPIEQKARLDESSKWLEAWDEEAYASDDEYIEAMEYWMPPISWMWLWLDRLITLLSKQDNVRDCVINPLMKPIKKEISSKEAEEKYRSKKIIVIGDNKADIWVVANAIWQLWIEIWAFTEEQLFDQKHLFDAENRLHFVDALYPMANLWWTQKDMANFILKCHENWIQPFDFSDIMRKAHSDKQMIEWYKKLKTKDIWYIAVWALLPIILANELSKWLGLYWEW